MNQNRSIALGVVAVVVLLAGLLVANMRSGGDGNAEKALYPSLKTEADNINAVRIFKAGDARVIELLRKDKDWTVTERGGYPADASKVRKLIVALSDAKIVEEKTSNPASYATLGVEDVSAKEATGVRLELAGGKTPINLIIGKTGNAEKAYARRAGEKPSWLLNTGIDAPQLIDAWLKRELIEVAGDRMQSARVTVGDKSYTAVKSARADGDFKVEGLPKGKEISAGAANSFASALQGLNLSEVRTAQEFGSPTPSATATLKTFDGLVAQLNGWVQDTKRYVSISTSYDEAQAQKFALEPAAPEPAAEAGKETTKSEQTPEPTPDQKVRDEATAANQRLTGWVFEIPSYKYDAIFKPVDQLLKK
jgi:hypothetical protein